MKDIMGQELAVGDTVVWGVKSGLRWGKVIEIDGTKRFGVRTQIGKPYAGRGGWMRGEHVAKVMDDLKGGTEFPAFPHTSRS